MRRHYGVLRAVLAHAVANDWIGRSPCRNVKLPSIMTTRRRHLDPDEVSAIARALPSDHRPIVWLGAILGLRWSEIAGLRVGRLDLLACRVTIAGAVTRGEGGRLVCGTPKSKAGRRTFQMPKALSEMLAEHLASRGLIGADSKASCSQAMSGGHFRIPTGVDASGYLLVAVRDVLERVFTPYDAPTQLAWWSKAWT